MRCSENMTFYMLIVFASQLGGVAAGAFAPLIATALQASNDGGLTLERVGA